jgi:hypothetical protein
VSSRKYRSSRDKSDEEIDSSRKQGEVAKKKPYEHGEAPQKLGRERQVHEEIIARRTEGGAPPTAEAYARALEQWQQLPGSIVRPPTDVRPPAQEPPKSSAAKPASEPTTDSANDEEH